MTRGIKSVVSLRKQPRQVRSTRLFADINEPRSWQSLAGIVQNEALKFVGDTCVQLTLRGAAIPNGPVGPPLMLTCTTTVGLTAGHRDVSLWYVIEASRKQPITFDEQ